MPQLPNTFGGWIVFIIDEYGELFLKGMANTLLIAILGTIIGFLIGLVVAIAKTIPVRKTDKAFKKIVLKILNVILSVYVEVFRGTPMMVQAMVIYYCAAQYLGLTMDPIFAGILIVSVLSLIHI